MKAHSPISKTVSCTLCASSTSKLVCVKDGLRVVRCSSCGLCYVNPRYTQAHLEKMYADGKASSPTYYSTTLRADQKTFEQRLIFLEKKLGRKGTLLDIGCNIGTLLFVALRRGWTCFGADINPSVRTSFKNTPISIKIGDILTLQYPPHSFDLVIMNDLIEHVPDPRALLRKVRTYLKDDGVLYVVTPDGGSFLFSLLRSHWIHLKPKEHLHYFAKKHLYQLFDEEGFSIESLRHVGRYRSLDTLATKSASLFGPFSSFATSLFRFLHIQNAILPVNLHDEYALIAKKKL